MKRLLLTLIFLLLAAPAWATWGNSPVIAQGASTDGHSPSAQTGDVDSTNVKGLFAFVATHPSCSGVGVIDSKGNSLSLVASFTGNHSEYVFKLTGTGLLTGTGHHWTPTTSVCANSFASITVLGFTNTESLSGTSLDVNITKAVTSTTIQVGAMSPASNNELLFAMASTGDIATWSGVDSGFTVAGTPIVLVSGQHYGLAVSYTIQTTATSVNPTWTVSASVPIDGINLSFRNVLFNQITALSCENKMGQTDVQNALNGAGNGDLVLIPSGTCTWTTPVSLDTPDNLIIQGQTTCTGSGNPAQNNLTCVDHTIILDNIDRSSSDMGLLTLNTGLGGSENGGLVQVTGLTFGDGGGGISQANIRISLFGSQLRFDHNNVNNPPGVPIKISRTLFGGVLDHNIIDASTFNTNTWLAYGAGQVDWSRVTGLGQAVAGASFLYVEDNKIIGGPTAGINDCQVGGRFVERFNTLIKGGVQTHPTNGSGLGCRALEAYKNTYSAPATGNLNAVWIDSGTGVIWGNTATSVLYANFMTLHESRANNTRYEELAPPNGWGYCGPSVHSGVINTTGASVTYVSGDHFATTWPAGTTLIIAGATCHDNQDGNAHPSCQISSVGSTTNITLMSSAGNLTGVAWSSGSNWDQNANTDTGHLCLDQPGAGQRDLLTGVFPNVMPTTWPNQASEPIYEWLDAWTGSGGGGFLSNYEPNNVVSNVDYYLSSNPGSGVNCTGFTGATGVGCGARASRPATCATGVAYFSTDQGSWNTSGSGGQGVLDKCTSTNTWTNAFYTPYIYPHPLDVTAGAYSFTFTVQPSTTLSGSSFSPTVAVTANLMGGGTDTGFNNSITLTINGCGATLTGSTSQIASSGVAVFSGLGVTGAATGCVLTATTSTIPSTSSSFDVFLPTLAFTTQPTSIVTATNFSPTVVVTARLPNTSTDTAFTNTITLTINGCGASLTGTTSMAAVAGVAAFTGLGATTVATGCLLTASATGANSGVSNSFDVTTFPCVPAKLAFTSQPSNANVGVTIGVVAVVIQSASGTNCSTATNSITFTNTAGTCIGMNLGGTTSGNAVAGIFSSATMTESAAGVCTLDASSAGLTGVTSSVFNISTPIVLSKPPLRRRRRQ